MAKVKSTQSESEPSETSISSEEKIARLLGLLLIKDTKKQEDQVVQLMRAGFRGNDVAEMLGISRNQVSVITYNLRRKSGGKGKSK